MRVEERHQHLDGIREAGRILDMVGADPVQPDVERIEAHARIDQHREGLDPVTLVHAGDADLADAGRIAAGGLDVDRDEPEATGGDAVRMAEAGSARRVGGHRCQPFGIGTGIRMLEGGAVEQPVEHGHGNTLPQNPTTQGRGEMTPARGP